MKLNINRNIITASLILSSLAPLASAEEEVNCAYQGIMAELVMGGRQVGVPISEAIALDPDNAYFKQMILLAHEEPAWSTAENQERAKREFRNKIELDCYKSLQK